MKRLSLLFCWGMCFLSLFSCSSNSDDNKSLPDVSQRKYASVEEEAEALALTVDELKEMPQDVKGARAAAIALYPYITLKDSTYTLDISKEEAEKIGVNAYYYDMIIQELKNTNDAIKATLKRGEEISLTDVKAEYKEYVKKKKLRK